MQALPVSFLRILDANRNPVGAGFLVSDRLVLSCAHVVAEALGQKDCPQEAPDTDIELDFPLLSPGQVFRARVVSWEPQRADGHGDIAGLEITTEPPSGAKSVRLVTAEDLWGHTCRALGFPRGYEMGLFIEGELRDLVSAGWLQFINPKQSGRFIQRGFSGGPVWDDSLQGVVGMIVASDQIDTAFCIPTDRLVSSWPALGEQTIPPCPYRGLFAFREQDALFFFGRETFVERLYEAVQRKTLVAVVGPSGSGKSSAVFAGLVPRLRAEPEWIIADFRPGTHPIEALATKLMPLLEPQMTEIDQLVEAHKLSEALQQGKAHFSGVIQRIITKQRTSRLLLVADQFEELYTSCPDPELRQTFLDGLLEAANQAKGLALVLAIRADFMGQVLAYRPFADALQDADLKLGPMTPAELRQAIERPAEKMGIRLQEGLVERILDDVGDQPGRLPLLEFALTELWERQSASNLTHEAYEAIKGVEGALADYADQVFADLDPEGQEQARRVLVRLVSPGAGTEDTRRVATRRELGEQPWELVKRLADFRLVVTDQTPDKNETAEIVHEALIHQWGKFQEWLSKDREFLVWQRRLRTNLEQWRASQLNEGALLYELSLAEAEDWLIKRADDLGEEEKEFIQASIERHNRVEEARERSRKRNQRYILAGSILLIALAIFGFWQSRRAENQAAIAETEAARARTAEVAREKADRTSRAGALTRGAPVTPTATLTPVLSVFLPIGTPTPTPAQSPPQVTLTSTPTVAPPSPIQSTAQPITVANAGAVVQTRWTEIFGAPVNIALSPDGKTLAVAGNYNILVFDLANLETPLFELKGQKTLSKVAFSPDGQTLASAGSSFDNTIWLWDMAKGGVKRLVLEGHTEAIYSIAFSPDGTLLASASRDKSVRMWDVQTGKELFFSQAHNNEVHSVAFSPDGTMLVSGGMDGKIRLWDVKSGQEKVAPLDAHPIQVDCLAFSPDGKLLASAGQYDTEIRLWDTQTWQPMFILRGHVEVTGHYGVFSLAFNHQGTLLASGGGDNSIRLWDIDPISPSFGKELATLQRHSDWVDSLVFSPDGAELISASERDGTIRIWEVGP